jgi:Kef-type K+ transport system membrane component KefB
MSLWNPGEIAQLLLAVLLIVLSARLLGALAAKLSLPALLGELLAGVLLGPTCVGALALPAWASLFPWEGPRAELLDLLTRLALLIFLIGAGVEVELDRMARHWRVALAVSAAGIAIPFALGFGAGVLDPAAVGWEGGAEPFHFSLFLGTSLAITALPVIARTLMDLNLYRSDLGMIVMSAAVFGDLVGWILFGLVVTLALTPAEAVLPIPARLVLTLCFTAAVLSLGRRLNLAALHAILRRTRRSGPAFAYLLGMGLLAAAGSAALGAGPMLGAFLAGAAASGSAAPDHRVFARLQNLVAKLCAPLFFGSIGLRVDFATSFDPLLVATVLALACAGKILGCGGAALASGTPPREAWALGFAMNSRGAMEIALALQALRYGLAGPRLFVALVVMAFVTSALAVLALRILVGRRSGALPAA